METDKQRDAATASSVLLRAIEAPETAALGSYDDAEPSEVSVRRMWGKIVTAPRVSPRRGTKALVLTFGVLATLAVLSALILWQRIFVEPLLLNNQAQLQAGETLVTGRTPRTLSFEEGSQIELAPESQLTVVSNDGPSLVLSLRTGSAHFSVTPGGPRAWTIEAGTLVVSVLGTEFSVSHTKTAAQESTSVKVSRGVVSVSGNIPGRSMKLRAGQSVTSMPQGERDFEPPQETAPSLGSKDRVFSLDDLPEDLSSTDETHGPASARSSEEGTKIEQLLREADQHRTAGRTAEAAKALRVVVDLAPPSDSRRALAALSYARLGLEPRETAALLEATLEQMPKGLREPALARLAESLALSGQASRAAPFAQMYLTEFPKGTRVAQMRALLSQ